MKIHVEFDVTPQEMRTFLGLPDVQPLQQDMLDKVRDAMQSGAAGLDAVNLMRPFLAPNLNAMEGFQRAMWQAFTQQAAATSDDAVGKTANAGKGE